MANKKDFIDAISEQISTLSGWLKELDEKSKGNQFKLNALRKQRDDRINQFAVSLLPDISETSLKQLAKRLPKFMTVDELKGFISDAQADHTRVKSRLLQNFRPDTANSEIMTLETELEAAERDFSFTENPGGSYSKITGFMELYNSGYSTSEYPYGIFDGQYYSDWKLGDQVLKASGCKNWTDLRGRYETSLRNYESLQGRVNEKKRALADLEGKRDSYNELLEAEANLPAEITEKIQVSIKAYLDTSESLPAEFADLVSLNSQIAELQKEDTEKIQANRTQISAQLLDLQKLQTKVNQSRTDIIPDKYVQEIRTRTKSYKTSRSSGGGFSGGGRSTHTTVYVGNDNWMLDAILYHEMMNHFDHSHSDRGGYGSRDYSERNYGGRSYERNDEPVYSTNDRVDDGGGRYSERNTVYSS